MVSKVDLKHLKNNSGNEISALQQALMSVATELFASDGLESVKAAIHAVDAYARLEQAKQLKNIASNTAHLAKR
jgi:hypothetical protein